LPAFSELIDGLGPRLVAGPGDRRIDDVTDDSREVGAGSLFLARPGEEVDGTEFISDALAAGAAGIVAPQPPEALGLRVPAGVAWAVDEAAGSPLAGALAERLLGEPSRKLRLIGITGTNGKTTTAFITAHLLQAAGLRCGMLGTIHEDDGTGRRPARLTTPGAITLSKRLSAMVENGCEAAAIEVSSHALAQGRVDALAFDVGVFTNLSGDHLDYHGTMEAYAQSKARLFEMLGPEATAVIHGRGEIPERLAALTPARLIRTEVLENGQTVSASPGDTGHTWCTARPLEFAERYTRARMNGPWGSLDVQIPLLGRHNLANTLAAAAAASAVTEIGPDLGQALQQCPQVPGRLERIEPAAGAAHKRPTVVVDYAHTHAALAGVLQSLRPLTRGRLIVVFGCGGDRDRQKRPKMAQVAAEYADQLVVTSDNPRTENLMRIIDDIMSGITEKDRHRIRVESERRKAILVAIMMAGEEDLVLIAGKGHENYQIIGTERRPFDDREEATESLALWTPEPEIRRHYTIPPSGG